MHFLVFMQITPPHSTPPFLSGLPGGRESGRDSQADCLPHPKMSSIGPRGGLTLCVFLLTSCCVYPTWLGRAATERKQQQHDSVVQGPRAIIAPRAVRLILSGIPLSLTSDISIKLKYFLKLLHCRNIDRSERGGYPKGLTKVPWPR